MRSIDADEVQKIIDHIRGKYVDAYGRRNTVNQFFWDTIRYIEKKVRSIPSVEPVRGEWEKTRLAMEYMCSNCQSIVYESYTKTGYKLPNFCPNCGADMRKER